MRKWWVILMTIVAAMVVLPGCGDNAMPDTAIVSNERFTLTGDSLIMSDTVIYSPDGATIMSNIPSADGKNKSIELSSKDNSIAVMRSEHTLVDALSLLSAQIISSHNANLQFASSNDMYDAIGLALSYTNPTLSMQLLRGKVENGRVVGDNTDFYPAHNDRLAWVTAAWRVYLVTGDREWLRWAYNVADATLRHDQDIAFDDNTSMAHGSSSDYTLLTSELPAWMGNNEVYACYTLNNNIIAAGALRDMASMADELGIDGSDLELQATHCIDAINSTMWNENRGRYTAMIYGEPFNQQAPCTDNHAQALAVMWGLADDDDRASTLIEKTAVTHCGVNTFYPARAYNADPALNEQGWGVLQGLWNMAAAHVDNDNALRRGLAALWRAQLLYSTRLASSTSTQLDVAMAMSNVAMTHRLLAGMTFEPQGIEFAPVVPSCLPGDKQLMGVSYRGATLDITIKGTGHEVDFILLDDKRIDGTFIEASLLTGRHSIVITMSQGHMGAQGATIVSQRTIRPDEPMIMWNGDSASIFNYTPSMVYKLVVDGSRFYSIDDSTFMLPKIDKFAQVAVVASNSRCYSYTSRPLTMGGKSYVYAAIADEASHSDNINVNVNVSQAGTYMLNVNYISPATSIDVRTVSANTHRMGIVVMSGLGTDSVASQSNIIPVDLLKGANTITVTAHPSSHTAATPLSLNLFKK